MNVFKRFFLVLILLNVTFLVSAFEEGGVLGLDANFSGSVTFPKIALEDLQILSPLGKEMTGLVSPMLMGGQLTAGYIFDAQSWFPTLNERSILSGFAVKGYVGVGQGNTSQKITAELEEGGEIFDIFMIVNFLPTLNLGAEFEVLMFENRFSVGVGIGTKAIMDMSPGFLVYSTKPETVKTEVGEIIVTPDMMTKMNAFGFSTKIDLGYSIPILPTTELVLGIYSQYTLYKPKYLTVPPSLLKMAIDFGASEDDINAPFPNYCLDSLDFGATIGLMFRL